MTPKVEEKPIKKESLRKNFLFNFINQVLVLIIPLITSPYLARVLGVEINGQISFATSIITYFTLAANFGFTTYGQREIAKYQNNKEMRSKTYWEIFTIRTLFTVVSLGILLTLVFANAFDEKYKLFLLIQSLTVLACCFDPSFYYQGMEEFKYIAIRTIVVRLIGLILIFAFIRGKDDAWLYVLSSSGVSFLSNFAMWPLIFKQTKRVKIRDLNIWQHFVPALFIFLPSLAVTIYSVLDKTMIGLLSANADYENGCYEKAYQLNSALLILVTVISTIMIPRNANDYAKGDVDSMNEHISFSINYTWLISIPLVVGSSILCYSLTSWFLGSEYEAVPLLLQIMSVRYVVTAISVIIGDQLFLAIGKEKYCFIVQCIGAVINFSLNFVFIHYWGAMGAAITTGITELVVCSTYLIIALKKKLITLKMLFNGFPKKLVATAVMFIPVFFMNMYLPYNVGTFLLIVLVGVITYAATLLLLRDEFFISLLKKGWEIVRNLVNNKDDKSNKEIEGK